jgi:hypothetical protein
VHRSTLVRLDGGRPPHLGPEQRVVNPALRLVHVKVGRHNVEVAGEHDGHAGREQLGRVRRETLEPAQLVVELGARCRIAIRQIEQPISNPSTAASM